MTSKTWPRASYLAAALLCAACQHPGEPPRTTAAPKQPDAPKDEGELRAEGVGAHTIGTLGPALAVKTLDGDTIDLATLYGTKPVYLKFWATWCIPCRKQMPGFEHIYETLGDRMQVIAVDAGLSDDEASVRAFREQYGLRMPVVVDDGRLAAALDLQVTPQHVLIGRDGRIAYVGHQDGDKLAEAIQKVLSEPGAHGSVVGRAVTIRPAFRPGDLVQELTATTTDGTVVRLGRGGDGRPRGVVLFSTWCESYLETSRPETSQACRRVREQVDQLMANGDVAWLGVVNGVWTSTQSVAEYQSETRAKLPLVLDADGALFRAFGVHQMPTVALLDPDGRLVRLLGPEDRDLAAAVRALPRKRH
jgi:peroxiredoxin